MEFTVTRDTMIPRPSSEALVHAALELIRKKEDARVLDLGTGSGCLLISIVKQAKGGVSGVGIDISAEAIKVAEKNAHDLDVASRVMFVQTSFDRVSDNVADDAKPFDCIVCNPPYLDRERVASDDSYSTLRFDPPTAIFADEHGYASYKAIANLFSKDVRLLWPNGHLVLEVGSGMSNRVVDIMKGAGLEFLDKKYDYSGCTRCLVFRMGVIW